MDKIQVLELLEQVSEGKVNPQEAAVQLQKAPFEDIGYAKIDYHRSQRQGVGEVIFGQGKTAEHILGIVQNMCENGSEDILITRFSKESAEFVQTAGIEVEYYENPKIGIVKRKEDRILVGEIVIASGGTSDIAVCEEAALTAEVLGNKVTRLYDVGVAGIHRLLAQQEILAKARVIIAVAGMEGALASVLGGLVSCPVIAVPTSVGYGANLGGVATLLSMLNSCASGVSVVNIDNGFGAGYIASRINQMEGIE